jgi:hypothetical protein
MKNGESLQQYLIRHYPDEWNNFIERMGHDFGTSPYICDQLRSGNLGPIAGTPLMEKFEHWANYRLPSHYRTLYGLSETKKVLGEEPFNMSGIKLIQILWPRESQSSGDDSAERMASDMGAEVMTISAGSNREMDLYGFLPMVRGTYLWIVPGCSRIFAPIAAMQLGRTLMEMGNDPRIALYNDGHYSTIYRVSALADVGLKTRSIPSDQRMAAKLLQESGYSLRVGQGSALCEFESAYCGQTGGGYQPARSGNKSFLGKLFGR